MTAPPSMSHFMPEHLNPTYSLYFRETKETLRDSRCFMREWRPLMDKQEITQWVNRKDGYLNHVSIARSRFGRRTRGLLQTPAVERQLFFPATTIKTPG